MTPYTIYDADLPYDSIVPYNGEPVLIVFHSAQTDFDTIVEVVAY